MVSREEEKLPKSEDNKSSLTSSEQSNVQVYPEWAAMQAYYGPRVPFPPPYYNSAVATGHPPPPHPYMWGPPQAMMAPPYGTPYAAIYAGGGVYAHPGIPTGLQPHHHGDGGTSSAATGETLAGTALSIDTPVKKKSSAKPDNGLVKKLKIFEGLTMSIGNGSSEKREGSSENRSSRSGDSEGSSDGSNGSDGNTERADENKRKRSRDDMTVADLSEKPETKPTPILLDANMCSSGEKVSGVPVSSQNGTVGMVTTNISSPVATTLELSNPDLNAKAVPAVVAIPNGVVPFDPKNEREIKKERRKQSNRESARRSRLRKQAETEELAKKVESLTAENMVLKSEINQLVHNSRKLRMDNADLTEKLKTVNHHDPMSEETGSSGTDRMNNPPIINTENFLARVNNSVGGRPSDEVGGGDAVSSGKKLHQLLSSNRRADAVAAG